MSTSRPDLRYVVVGCGGVGSAATYWLSRAAGGRVLALERDTLGRDRGAGRERILRYAQHRDAYAALAPAAYATWRDVERVSAQSLVTETGGLIIEDVETRQGPTTAGREIGRRAAVADRHDVDFDLLDARGIERRWPQFRLAGTEQALYQRRAGIIDPRRADATHVALARGHGAEIREHSPVRALRPTRDHVEVVLDDEVIRAERVVVAAEARTNEVLDGLIGPLPLTVIEEQVTSYATPNLLDFSPARFPVFRWHGAEDFSGVPVHGEVATTLGQHLGAHETTGDTGTDEAASLRRKRREAFLAEHLPGFLGPELDTTTRRYTIPSDQHLVLATLPGEPRVSVAVGAGQAVTFASLIGRILAELATTGATRHPIATFALDRPALTDPQRGHHSCG